MNSHPTTRSDKRSAGFVWLWLASLCTSLGASAPAAAQNTHSHHAPDNAIDAWARWAIVQGQVWKGAITPFPQTFDRPADDGYLLRSWSDPVTVHAPADLDPGLVNRTLAAAERAYAWLRARGWPLPPPDGGRGSTPGFDLYLQRATQPFDETTVVIF